MFKILFPSLLKQKFALVNLNEEAKLWAYKMKFKPSSISPFLDPKLCDKFVNELALHKGAQFTYGGYLEDRSFIWQGSYIEEEQKYFHLGIDYNVPADTPIFSPVAGKVLVVDDDQDEQGGWGPRLIVAVEHLKLAVIFGHLKQIKVSSGDPVIFGSQLAQVGSSPNNGNWFPHLHLQCVRLDYLLELIKAKQLTKLDGYGQEKELKNLRQTFPNPEIVLS